MLTVFQFAIGTLMDDYLGKFVAGTLCCILVLCVSKGFALIQEISGFPRFVCGL